MKTVRLVLALCCMPFVNAQISYHLQVMDNQNKPAGNLAVRFVEINSFERIEKKTNERRSVVVLSNDESKVPPAWDVLERKVKDTSDFAGKADALELITDIKTRLSRSEKIPNYMVEALKSSLTPANLTTELQTAIDEVKKGQQ